MIIIIIIIIILIIIVIIIIIIIFVFSIFETVTDTVRIIDVTWTDDRKLLQESNLTARQPRTAPHHVIQITAIEGLVQGPYVAATVKFEPAILRKKGAELTTQPPLLANKLLQSQPTFYHQPTHSSRPTSNRT